MTYREAKAILKPLCITINRNRITNEYMVGRRYQNSRYYTDNLDDAVETGIHMATESMVAEERCKALAE